MFQNKNILIEVAHENRVLRLVQQRSLLANLLLGSFAFGYVAADRDVLVGFSFGVEKRNYRRVDPIVTAVLGAILDLATPYFAARDRRPEISDELFGMVRGIDDAVVLAEQFFAGVFRDLAKLVVDVIDDAALIGDRDDRRFIKRKLDVCEFLLRAL